MLCLELHGRGFYEKNNGWLRYFDHHLRRRALRNGWRQNRRPKSRYQVRCRENSARAGQRRQGPQPDGSGGYYESEWSYHAIEGDKGLYFDVLYAGRDAPA